MKKIFFILIILISLLATGTPLQAKTCQETIASPTIEFYTSYGKLTYDYSKSQSQITKIAKDYGILEQGLFASGLATSDVNWELSLNTASRYLSSQELCVEPQVIKFYIGFSDPTIYISNRLLPGTCEYEVVLRHEQTHQQINKATLDYFIPLFQQALQKIVTTIPNQKITHLNKQNVNHATQLLSEQYTAKIAPLIDIFKKELATEQGKLDNMDNYDMESLLCTGR